MAWTTPRTWVSAAILTAAQLNVDTRDNSNLLKSSLDDLGNLSPVGPSELTISAGGAIVVTQNVHTVDTNSDDASDDLDDITLGSDTRDGMWLILLVEDVSRVVTVKSGTGNIRLANEEDFIMTSFRHQLFLYRRGGTWYEVSRSYTKGITTMLADPVQVLDVASTPGADTYTAWATLDLGGDVPAGSLAALVMVQATDSAGAVARVRQLSGDEEAYGIRKTSADLDDGDGNVPSILCIVNCDADGDIEFQYGDTGAGNPVGMEVWVVGRIDP